MEEPEFKRMQVKVLYSFNNNNTVFLSRSTELYSIRIATIPSGQEDIVLGGYDLKNCIHQILKSSPENFHLATEDYAVYYKDLTEQPDEPFVSNGVLSELLKTQDTNLIPGRVCQNLSASFLFGNKHDNSLTLEVRLKLHTIDWAHDSGFTAPSISNDSRVSHNPSNHQHKHLENKRRYEDKQAYNEPNKKIQPVLATRTKSLPVFHQPFNHMYNIRNADKMNVPSKYDPQRVQNRFKLAPFVEHQVIDKPKVLRRRNKPIGAMRTRSMIATDIISSPILEEGSSDTDDTEYNDNTAKKDEDNDDDDYSLEKPSYKSQLSPYKEGIFESLPDLEDLNSKKTHTIPNAKLPKDHGLICVNPNCATDSSISWRYFEIDFRPNFFEIHRAKEFDKKNYEGMYGPLCNACFLFLRNKGFMRPENVVRKYLKQQRYKKEKERDEDDDIKNFPPPFPKKPNHISSSPMLLHKFATPTHTPSEINQVIQNNKLGNQELNDFLHQINNFGGPLTDIDLPDGPTPPMMATKSNTRLINIDDDNKENYPPPNITQYNTSNSPAMRDSDDFEKLIIKSFSKSSPLEGDWMNIFSESTPKDQVVTPLDDRKVHPSLPQMKTFNTRRSPRLNKIKNISSSPPPQTDLELLEKEIHNLRKSSPERAERNDTSNLILSLYKNEVSSPSEVYENKTKPL